MRTSPVFAAYLGVILIWSTTPLGIQWSAQGAGFSFAVAARMVIGLAVCGLLMRITRTPWPRDAAAQRLYWVSGLSIYGSMILTYWGALHVPSGLISVIFGLLPLASGILAVLWLREHTLNARRLLGLALALGGLWIVFGEPWPGGAHATLGTAAVLGGMSLQALGLVWIKRLNVPVASLAMTAGALTVATPLFLLTWLLVEDASWPVHLGARAGWAIVYLGVLGSVVGFTLYYYVVKRLEAARAALITLITPVTALLLGQALNSEYIPPGGWLGIALIGAGLLLHEAPWRRSIS